MGKKIYARIDERLIHGQVSLRWKQAYQITRYIVVDDSCFQDTFRQKLLTANDQTPAVFVSMSDAKQSIEQFEDDTLLLIVPSPREIFELVNQGVHIDLCNIGNMRMDENRVQIGTSVAISPEEKEILQQLLKKGIALEMRPYPESEVESLEMLEE